MPVSRGVLRGHSPDCVHDISRGYNTIEELEATNWRKFETNPSFPGMSHSVTMALSINQVREYILEPHSRLPPRKPRVVPDLPRFTGAYAALMRSRLGAFEGTDVSVTMAYMWKYCRSGIFVSIRRSRLSLFVPFCNPEYENTWSPQARANLPAGPLPAGRWWSNGWMLCEMQPTDAWGDTWVTTLRNMLEASCATGQMGDCDFILNKRDTPMVRRDGKDPMNPFDALPRIIDPSALIPVLSFNGGRDYADVCCPLAVDWHRATGKTYAQKRPLEPHQPLSDVYWEHKAPVAVWRGSMTGIGVDASTNQRAYLCNIESPLLNCKLTGCNLRWKVCPYRRCVVRGRPIPDVGPCNYMSMQEQQKNFRYAICVDGHGAADRLGDLLNGRQCLLKVMPARHTLGHCMWLQDFFWPWEHYVPVV